MDQEDVAEIQRYLPNGQTKTLRACLRCRQIMNKEQFIEFGCPNCRDVLEMQGNESRVVACTTTNYQGFISLIRPGTFTSRFNGLEGRRPGCYALTVQGIIPDYIMNEKDDDDDDESQAGSSSGEDAARLQDSPIDDSSDEAARQVQRDLGSAGAGSAIPASPLEGDNSPSGKRLRRIEGEPQPDARRPAVDSDDDLALV